MDNGQTPLFLTGVTCHSLTGQRWTLCDCVGIFNLG